MFQLCLVRGLLDGARPGFKRRTANLEEEEDRVKEDKPWSIVKTE